MLPRTPRPQSHDAAPSPAPPAWASTLPASPEPLERDPPLPLVSSRLQPVVAVLAAVGLAAMAVWFQAAGGFSGGLVAYRNTSAATAPSGDTGYTIDINTASRVELLQLPRVGPSLADRIIDRRQTVAPYATPEDLLSVPGIGEITLADIRPFLRPLPADTPAHSQPLRSSSSHGSGNDDIRTGQ